MQDVYWICLFGGLVFSVLTLLFGDLLDGVLDGFDALDGFDLLDPLSLVGGVTVFGGAGVVLTETTDLAPGTGAALAALIGLALAIAMHFVYVRPMKRSENSTGFSLREYHGKLGEVITAIPAAGYGEVIVKMGASNTFRTAASFEGKPIPRGTRVVVVEIRDGDLLVTPFDELTPVDDLPKQQPPHLSTA
jgi:membrane protein implicated in regulation of membrane protease activity